MHRSLLLCPVYLPLTFSLENHGSSLSSVNAFTSRLPTTSVSAHFGKLISFAACAALLSIWRTDFWGVSLTTTLALLGCVSFGFLKFGGLCSFVVFVVLAIFLCRHHYVHMFCHYFSCPTNVNSPNEGQVRLLQQFFFLSCWTQFCLSAFHSQMAQTHNPRFLALVLRQFFQSSSSLALHTMCPHFYLYNTTLFWCVQ